MRRLPVQQPRQMFFSWAFMRASSALMVSTYPDGSGFEATGRIADFAGGAALS
jgi:hypothetical protein